MAKRRPRDPSKPHPWWNTPLTRTVWRPKKGQEFKPRQRAAVSRRDRAEIRRRLKRRFGLDRRQSGAIGAGHVEAPEGYRVALSAELERARFRGLA